MLLVLAEARIDPAQLDQVRAFARPMIEASRAEAGCISYDYALDLLEPGLLRVTERWKDWQALNDHFAAPHMTDFVTALRTVAPKSVTVKCYELGAERAMPGR